MKTFEMLLTFEERNRANRLRSSLPIVDNTLKKHFTDVTIGELLFIVNTTDIFDMPFTDEVFRDMYIRFGKQ